MGGLSTYTLTKLVFWLHIKTMIESKESREIYDAVKLSCIVDGGGGGDGRSVKALLMQPKEVITNIRVI